MEINTKKQLAIILSRLKGFPEPNFRLEQYMTEADFAAEVVWNAFYRREIEEKTIADLGCGTGILGLSTLLMGASKVYFVDIDEKALSTARENLAFLEKELDIELKDKAEFVVSDVKKFDDKVDIVVENPPFGIKGEKHADKVFLEKAMSIAEVVYSFHKKESSKFIEAVAKDNGFKVEGYWEFNWSLKQTMKFHKKKVQKIEVSCWRLVKK